MLLTNWLQTLRNRRARKSQTRRHKPRSGAAQPEQLESRTLLSGVSLEWVEQFGAEGPSFDAAQAADADGNVYIAGRTDGVFPGGQSIGDNDAFVTKLDSSGDILWTRQFGSASGDYALGITVDGSGIYVAGQTNGTFSGEQSAGSTDAFVAKLDSSGNILWTEQFGTASSESVTGITADSTGIYVNGETSGTFAGEQSFGGRDAFVTKLDRGGNILWTEQFGTAEYDQNRGIAANSSGIYVTGHTTGTFAGEQSAGGFDAFVTKLNSSGSIVWTEQFGTGANDFGGGIAADSSGIYVSGQTTGTFSGEQSTGSVDAFVRKFDANGNVNWTEQFGTGSSVQVSGITTDSSGVYVTGHTTGAFPGEQNLGSNDAFATKLDRNGFVHWTEQFGTGLFDRAWGITADGSGIYVTGSTEGTFPGERYAGAGDVFVTKLDSSRNILWTTQFGAAGPSAEFSRTIDADGNIYVTGQTRGTFGDEQYTGSDNVFVTKLDPLGNILWTKQFATDSTDQALGIITDNSDVYVVGHTLGSFLGEPSAGSRDVFVMKLDDSGNVLWTKQFGTSSGDSAAGIDVDSSGIYITGQTPGTFAGEQTAGGNDTFVTKLDAGGAILWTEQFGTASTDFARGITVNSSGVYITGFTDGAFAGHQNAGSFDSFVTKLDRSGNVAWTGQFGTSLLDAAFGITSDSSGIYVSGYTDGTFAGEQAAGGGDTFVTKFDSGGTVLWTEQFGTAAGDFGYGITASDSGVYVTGQTNGTFAGEQAAGGSDAFVTHLDSSGSVQWTEQFGTASTETAAGIAVHGSGIYVSGYTDGTFAGEQSAGDYDVFIVKFQILNSSPTDMQLSQVTVDQSGGTNAPVGTLTTTDPNTVDTHTYYLVAGTGDAHNVLFRITGNQLMADDASTMAAGSYSVRIRTDDGAGGIYEEVFTIEVIDNVATSVPADIDGANNSVFEASATGTSVGLTAQATDSPNSAITYDLLLDDAGGRFTIDNTTGQVSVADGALLNFESDSSHTIVVRATDAAGNSSDRQFTIQVLNVAPTARDDQFVTGEHDPFSGVSVLPDNGSGADADPNGGSLAVDSVNGIVGNAGNPVSGSNGGIFVVNSDGTMSFDPGSDFDELAGGETNSTSVTYTVTDGIETSNTAVVTVEITGLNDEPTVSAANALVTGEEGTTITNSGAFADVDLSDSVTVTASVGTISQDSGNSGSWSWSFLPSDDLPLTTVTITADDGNGGLDTVTFEMAADNVAPAVTGLALSSYAITENESTTVSGTITDAGSADTFTVEIDWTGDGLIDETHTNVAAGPFSYSRTYVDDDPTGTPADKYDITVYVTDDDGATWDAGDTDDTAVNAPTRYSQSWPDIVSLDGGGYVVVWHGSRDQGYGDGNLDGVFGQRFDEHGLPAGSSFQVNSYTQGYQKVPSVGALADGGFVVAWASSPHPSSSTLGPQDGSASGVFAQRFDATGGPVGSEFQVNTTTAGSQGLPSVSGLADGGFAIAWAGPDAEGNGVFLQIYAADGSALGSETQVNNDAAGSQYRPEVAALADGGFAVTWDEATVRTVRAQRFNSDGAAVGTNIDVTNSSVITNKQPTVTGLVSGGFVVGWTGGTDGSQNGVFAQIFDDNSDPVGAEFRVNTTTDNRQDDIRLTATEDGGFVAVWDSLQQDGSSLGVYAQRFDAAGEPSGIEIAVNQFTANSQSGQVVTGLPGSDFAVAWLSYNQDGERHYNVYTRKFSAASASGSATLPLTVSNAAPVPAIAGLPDIVAEGDSVPLTGTVSDQGPDDTYVVEWRVLKDGVTYATSNDINFTFVPDDNGTYVITLTATDDDSGVGVATATVDVVNTAPSATGLSLSESAIEEGQTVTLTGSLSDAGPTDTFTIEIDWDGNGSFEDVRSNLPAGSFSLAHTFEDDIGDGLPFDVRVRVSDNDGAVTAGVDGNEYAVNAPTRYSQDLPNIIGLTGGGFVVVWSGSKDQGYGDGNVDGVFAQRYDATGVAMGAAVQVNTYTGGYQQWASVGALSNGGFVVTWQSRPNSSSTPGQDGDGIGIFAQRFDASGARAGTEFPVNTTTDGSQSFASVTGLSGGGFVIAWGGPDGDGNGVFEQQFAANGSPVGGEQQVNTVIAGIQERPIVTALADGGFLTVWDDRSTGTLGAQRFDSSGQPVGVNFTANTTSISGNRKPTAAGLADGGFVVGWTGLSDGSSNGVVLQRYDASGTPAGSAVPVNTYTTSRQAELRLSATTDGGFVAVWDSIDQDGSNLGVFAQRFDAAGNRRGTEFPVNQYTSNTQYRQTVAGLADGSIAAAWLSYNQDGLRHYNVYARRLIDGASAETATFPLTVSNVAPTATIGSNGPVDENSPVTVSLADPVDPSAADSAALRYSFAVDTASLAVDYSAAGTAATADFTFPDEGTFTVFGRIYDDDGGSTDYNTDVTVNNVAPTVTADNGAIKINEGQTATNTGSFADAGPNDTVTLTASLGVVTGNGDGTWSWSHTAANDLDTTSVTITASDDDGDASEVSFDLTVTNVAATFDAGADETLPTGSGAFSRGGIAFSDDGVVDVHTLTVDFGDDSGSQAVTLTPTGIRTFDLSHTYESSGTFPVTVSLNDGTVTTTDTFDVTVNLEIFYDFSSTVFTAIESDSATSTATVTVMRSGATTIPSTANLVLTGDTAIAGTDFTAGPLDLSFAANELSKTVAIELLGDNLAEATESLGLSFSNFSIGGLPGTVQPTATLTITDDDAVPVPTAGGPYVISEGDALTLDASASTDADDGITGLTFRWDVDGDGDFDENITGSTPTLSLADLSALGLDDGPANATVTVEATDGTNTEAAQVALVVNNAAPITTDATFTVIENSPDGTHVGGVSASDPGPDTLTYSITGGTGSSAFGIDEATGEITVIDQALLDFETTPSLTLEITIADGDGGIAVSQVTVDLINQASISGVVFVDTNENGAFDGNEMGIDGVTVDLLNETGDVLFSTVTSDGGLYFFEDLDAGTYQIREVQPTGVDDGAESTGNLGGTVVADDLMQITLQREDATDYDFAELGQQLGSGDSAGIGFWQNKHGQALIAEGGPNLAKWLSETFPNIFGSEFVLAQDTFASGLTVAKFYREQLFRQKATKSLAGPPKVDAQFMAVAFATYFTSHNLAGDVAQPFGFNVTDTGIGTNIVNVGSSGAAFDVDDDTEWTILQLLLATNGLTGSTGAGYSYIYDTDGNGVIDANEESLRRKANFLFSTVNGAGGI